METLTYAWWKQLFAGLKGSLQPSSDFWHTVGEYRQVVSSGPS